MKVLKAIPAEERTVKSLDLDKLPLERTLGLYWDTETDTLAVKVSLSHGKDNCHTRRDCLSKLSSTFDPLGLRKESGDGTVESAFIMAKSRCAPLQYVSLPRLELQAATIAARVHRLVSSEINLEISASFFWTDSKVTLQYVKNESRRFKIYVANRVCEIRSVSQPSQWRYCPSILNPADDASRGLTVHQLLTS